jgi:phospholipid/cholesterol/gamma-HCH transport system substrate-binding protein/paraquat-inducible protein B
MDDSKRYHRLGLFVVASLGILAIVFFILGGRSLFQSSFTFETYFDGSVAGLEIGAPVRFRGVPLGQVTDILTSGQAYEGGLPVEKRKGYIVVRGTLKGSRARVEGIRRDLPDFVQHGMRVQTRLEGITGQQSLALDLLDPKKYPPLPFDWKPEYEYLPSAPSLTGQILNHVEEFLVALNEADIRGLVRDADQLVTAIHRKVDELPMAKLSADADAFLNEGRDTVARIDKALATGALDDVLRNLDSTSKRLDALLADPALKQTVDNLGAITGRLRALADSGEIDRMVKNIDSTAARLDALIGDNQYDVRVIVQDLRSTANNLRTLSDALKRYPAGALLGGPPEKVQLPGRQP